MEINETKLYPVLQVALDKNHQKWFEEKEYRWFVSDDSEKMNVLAYIDDLVIEGEVAYINVYDYQAYKMREGKEWLISTSMLLNDVNTFFEWYSDEFK